MQLKVDIGEPFEIHMREFQAQVLPSASFGPTKVWGYILGPGLPSGTQTSYIGPVVVATRHTPTEIKFFNNLPTSGSLYDAWKSWLDTSLHWADPGTTPLQVPAVPHLHGGEVPPQLDGGPDAWFTSGGTKVGHAYYSKDGTTPKNYATFRYPNTQEAANIWFHDHGLGITRLNVYAGLAGAYVLKDGALTLPAGLTATGLDRSGGSAVTDFIIPLVIQDRMFDTNGQLYFPNVGINPEHPQWIPEFLGDAIVVNGKTWPFRPVLRQRYRFLFLNGSNARAYEMWLKDPVSGIDGPPMWVIGTDGGYLDAPVKIDPRPPANGRLVMLPGERYDVIIDFGDPDFLARIGRRNNRFSGKLWLLNTGRTPYPDGPAPDAATVGRIMEFRVGAAPAVADNSYNPANGIPLRPPMVRLVDPVTGTPAAGVVPQLRRQLTLNEFMGPGGPLEVLVNNTKWSGKSVALDYYPGGVRGDFHEVTNTDSTKTYYSELSKEGSTELWEIINLTADAHPIHLHLVQFQLMNRQKFNMAAYNKAYNALFPPTPTLNDPLTGLPYPGGAYIGTYGPPLGYMTVNADGAFGGNPAVTPYLSGPIMPPLPHEAGWKDTVIMLPGEVTRIMVRWAPTDLPVTTAPAAAYYPFDPNAGHGFVWHCHIIDHEDNEMMRPNLVIPNPSASRTLHKGTDY
ncbi:MAG: multicopper oxidase family protein [Planctomycetota bacterium]